MPAFPYKLHELLETTTADAELGSIISWLPDGKSFRIHSQDEFEKRLLKRYFPRQTQVKSFKRQLQYYDFQNFGDGLFSHPSFIRGQRNLCGRIIHQLPTKSQKAGGGTVRAPKARGRKKRSHTSSSSSSGPLNSRILKAAAGDASIVSYGSESSPVPDTYASRDHYQGKNLLQEPSPKTASIMSQAGIPKFVEHHLSPRSTVPSPSDSMVMMSPAVFTTSHIMQPSIAQLHHMQAMQMARQRYLSCLEQEIMFRSMLQRANILPPKLFSQHQQAVPQPVASSSQVQVVQVQVDAAVKSGP